MLGFRASIRQGRDVYLLDRLLTAGASDARTIAAAIRRFEPAFIMTAARGSSDNAARYAKYLFGAHNRLVVSLGAPSLMTLYESPPALHRAVILGISQSGQSPDIVALLAEGRRQGALTIAVTNKPDSPMAATADFVHRTFSVIADGQEDEFIDLDGELDELLWRA